MRKFVIASVIILPLLAVATYAAQCFSFEPLGESFGYSSDETFGGGSYLGVDTRDVSADRLGALKLKEERGVEVTLVDQDAPAGKAGLKEHDVILTLNGASVESVEQLRRMIHEIPPGRVITLGIARDGQPMTIKAQLADRKKTFAYSGAREFKFAMPAIPAVPAMPGMPDIDVPVSVVVVHSSTRSGLMIENLTPQLGDFFGAKDGQGVLVRSVEKGSRAEKAGFRAGDVIVKVNGEPIHDAGDFTHSVRGGKDNAVSVTIIRDKKEQTLTLTLPDHKQSGDLFEESFDIPEMDAETRIDLSELQSEMARAKPQITLAIQEARRAAEETRKTFCEQSKEIREQQEQLREELRQQEQELRDEMREQQQELREELQDLNEI